MSYQERMKFVAQELRRLAPAARSPEGGTTHDGRRAFQLAAEELDRLAWKVDNHVGGIK
jgi:hypothetical protein